MDMIVEKHGSGIPRPGFGGAEGVSPYRNSLLIAMPAMRENFFMKSVIYVCAHSDAGAMGIVINQKLPDIAFSDLLDQLMLPQSEMKVEPVVHFGGPVDTGRGFVLHSGDFMREDTVKLDTGICITGTVDILKAMAEGRGPSRSIFALGYAGWGPGQLEAEMQANSWLTAPADDDLVFSSDLPRKWEKALSRLGVSPLALSAEAGHA
jgi:putative transcriptional regulator